MNYGPILIFHSFLWSNNHDYFHHFLFFHQELWPHWEYDDILFLIWGYPRSLTLKPVLGNNTVHVVFMAQYSWIARRYTKIAYLCTPIRSAELYMHHVLFVPRLFQPQFTKCRWKRHCMSLFISTWMYRYLLLSSTGICLPILHSEFLLLDLFIPLWFVYQLSSILHCSPIDTDCLYFASQRTETPSPFICHASFPSSWHWAFLVWVFISLSSMITMDTGMTQFLSSLTQ